MNRIFGMMPRSEVKIEKKFKDPYGYSSPFILQAGEHGWTVIMPDGGSRYKDENDTPENNYQKAYDIMCSMYKGETFKEYIEEEYDSVKIIYTTPSNEYQGYIDEAKMESEE